MSKSHTFSSSHKSIWGSISRSKLYFCHTNPRSRTFSVSLRMKQLRPSAAVSTLMQSRPQTFGAQKRDGELTWWTSAQNFLFCNILSEAAKMILKAQGTMLEDPKCLETLHDRGVLLPEPSLHLTAYLQTGALSC